MRNPRGRNPDIPSVCHNSPMPGLNHLKSKISYDGIRYYDIAAGPEMYPRYHHDERARFDPHDRDLDDAFDVVIHLTNGALIIRGYGAITKAGFGGYYFSQNAEQEAWIFVSDFFPSDKIAGVYRISSRITTRHHPDYVKRSPKATLSATPVMPAIL